MAYSTSNPPILAVQGIGYQTGARRWYLTGTDAIATVDTSGYISNGGQLGMKVGDLVEYFDSNLKVTYNLNVDSVNATTGAVDLQDSTIIGSTTNTD